MKYFNIFIIISLIIAGGFYNNNSTEQHNYNLSLYEVKKLDLEKLPSLINNQAIIVFTPTSFTSSELELISVPLVIDYQLISDFELVLNVISR